MVFLKERKVEKMKSTYAYVGCRTTKERNARGKGIKVFEILENGDWKLVQTVENLVNPSYLCMDQEQKFLYTIHGDFSEISSFAVHEDGTLCYINTVSTGGVNPVHLNVEKTNRYVYVANLQTGTVAVIPRKDDGSLEPLKELYELPGKGEGCISHPHQTAIDRSGEYLAVSCQGRKAGFGQVDVFRINHETGALEKTDLVKSREIAEPRHLVFHPENRWCYGVNEKDYSITYYQFDSEQGKLSPKQILPTLPDTYTGDGWASGIIISEDGKYVVVSNRKHDSITSFQIHPETGMMRFCDCIKTGGGQPRFITFDKKSECIFAANETTDTITEIQLDPETGKFSDTGKVIETESPVCIIFR